MAVSKEKEMNEQPQHDVCRRESKMGGRDQARRLETIQRVQAIPLPRAGTDARTRCGGKISVL
jgi:hypothetical protein